MSKKLWKYLMYSKPVWYLIGKSGALGEEGKQAADEYEAEIPEIVVIVFVILALVIIVLACAGLFNS